MVITIYWCALVTCELPRGSTIGRRALVAPGPMTRRKLGTHAGSNRLRPLGRRGEATRLPRATRVRPGSRICETCNQRPNGSELIVTSRQCSSRPPNLPRAGIRMPSPVLFRKDAMNARTRSTLVTRSGDPSPFSSFSLGGRRTWLAVGAVALVGSAALNWSWLVAVGVAPLLLAIAPCAAMCALGLCMKQGTDGCERQDATTVPSPASVPVEAGGAGRA
jgi:hypothetical protein